MILTADQVRSHLRYLSDELSDSEAEGFIAAAEQVIKDYITDEFDPENPAMIHAAKIMVGYFDEFRNAELEMPTNGNYLPPMVCALLYKYRTPTAI